MSILKNILSGFKLFLKEYLIGKVSFKFPYNFNYTDQHTVPHGFVDFGRGLIGQSGQIIVTGAGNSHDQIEKSTGSGIRFYWGLIGRGNTPENSATLCVVSKNSRDDNDLRKAVASIAGAVNNHRRNQLKFTKKIVFLN